MQNMFTIADPLRSPSNWSSLILYDVVSIQPVQKSEYIK